MTDGADEPETAARKSLWEQIKADSDAVNRVKVAVMKDLEPYTARLTEGIERVNKLLSTASQLTNPPSLAAGQMDELTREAAQDILRAAVVLMHAYLEDFLRTIALALLPSGDGKLPVGYPPRRSAGSPGKVSSRETCIPQGQER